MNTGYCRSFLKFVCLVILKAKIASYRSTQNNSEAYSWSTNDDVVIVSCKLSIVKWSIYLMYMSMYILTRLFCFRWIFGPFMCKFYVFWCKFTPIAAASMLAVTLYAEYQQATQPGLLSPSKFERCQQILSPTSYFWDIIIVVNTLPPCTWCSTGTWMCIVLSHLKVLKCCFFVIVRSVVLMKSDTIWVFCVVYEPTSI